MYNAGDLSKLFNPTGGDDEHIQQVPAATIRLDKANLKGLTKNQRKKVLRGKLSLEQARKTKDDDGDGDGEKKDGDNDEQIVGADGKKIKLSRKKRAAQNSEKLQKAKERQKKQYVGKVDDMHTTDERLNRTVFIGNVPINTKEKELKEIFAKYGKIESVRFRSLSRADPKISKRAAFAKKEFHEERDACNVYIVYKEEEGAVKSLEYNGNTLKDQIIRVDLAGNSKKNDNQNSVFVGNLDFKAKEDELRTFFMTCGTISNVRLVRDNFSSMGKGFGFVTFQSAASVRQALTFDGCQFAGRSLRVYKAVDKPKKFAKKVTKNGIKSTKKNTGFKRKDASSWEGERANNPNMAAAQKRKKQKHASRNTVGKTTTNADKGQKEGQKKSEKKSEKKVTVKKQNVTVKKEK